MIRSLTSLRGVFILFIFFHHCLHLYPDGGTMAVTFFFVLGGFSMTLGYGSKLLNPGFDYIQYIKKRGIKFYPLHWLCLFAVMPIMVFSFNIKQLPVLFANAILIQSWIPIQKVYFSFNWVSWYLADTMFFAVMFPLVFKFIASASNKGRVLFAVILAAIYAVVAVFLPKELYHAILYISPYMRLFDFIFGIYLALVYLSLKEQPTKWMNKSFTGQILTVLLILALVVESCLLPENATWFAPVYWLFVGALILTVSLTGRSGGGVLLENKYLFRLGEMSFLFFMIHKIVLRYTTLVFKIIHFDNSIVYVLFTLLLTVVLSSIVERYFLKPITQWLTKRNQMSMTARS